MKVLIDRSLVLGTVDRPQLHDIVLEFLLGQFSPEELKAAHKRIVNAFRASRPEGTFGWQKKTLLPGDGKGRYITNEVSFHIKEAWNKDWQSDTEAIGWLSDCTNGVQDAIPRAASSILGTDKMLILIQKAEDAGDWWLAALRQASRLNQQPPRTRHAMQYAKLALTDGATQGQPRLYFC